MTFKFFLVLFFGSGSLTLAAIRPSFSLDSSSWHATHILLASEGEQIDGRLAVLESWKGDLSPGDLIYLPELASFNSRESRRISAGLGTNMEGPVAHVTGSRIILFLRAPSPQASENEEPGRHQSTSSIAWKPADDAGMNVSVVWIEAGRTFAFSQLMNPGPSLLTFYPKSEIEIRVRVSEILDLEESLNATLAIADCARRAESLQPFVLSDLFFARKIALDAMQTCGESALPVLRQMLGDPTLLRLHGEIVKRLSKAGGNMVGEEITRLVIDEMEFWKTTAPSLKAGWWNQMNELETQILRERYVKVYDALCALGEMRFAGCRAAVSEFRDLWRSFPQLEDSSGLSQLSQECDRILDNLP